MSGRARHLRDGEWITNRKTDRRQSARTKPQDMPDWRLSFILPDAIAFSVADGPTAISGVTVSRIGHVVQVEARGKNRDWVLQQASTFLGTIAGGLERKLTATLERGDEPAQTSGAPAHGRYKATREMVYVPGASVVFLHPLKGALVYPAGR